MKLLTYFFISFFIYAEDQKSAQKVLENMTLTYSQVNYMKSNFEQIEKSKLLGTEQKSKGKLEYSKGKIRLDFEDKEKGLMIKGDKKVWQVSGDGTVVVMDKSKAIPSIFDAVFTDVKVWKKLKSKFIGKPGKYAVVSVDTDGKVSNIKNLELKIDQNKRTIEKMTYVDDLDNEVTILFKSVRFFNTAKDDRFVYKIKAGDKVSQM